MTAWLTKLVMDLGPLGVFLLMVPESACIPVPSELTLMCSGFAVGQGWVSLPLAVAAAIAGNLVGSLIAYTLGRAGAMRGMGDGPAARMLRCERLLDRHGTRAVFLARLLPLARTFVSLPAGHARVPLLPFVLLTSAGCALWSLAFTLAGAAAGEGWAEAGARVGHAMLAVTAAGALVALAIARRRRA